MPVKFRLTDAAGAPVNDAVADLSVAPVSGGVAGAYAAATSAGGSNQGNEFRLHGSGGYVYNLSTSPLSAGTWSLRVTFADGTRYDTRIVLR